MKKIVLTLVLLFSLVTPIYSQTGKSYFEIGYEKFNRGDYKGAIQNYTKAIELNPKYATAYINRAAAKGKLGKFKEAVSLIYPAFYTKVSINSRKKGIYHNHCIHLNA
ncbi:tetratricopeptide repeat protein [Desulfobacterota bacterium AH_259_B03_O07]|nr:tetratricopeptide repeat protein [Desulfobacterota bacterium AH_259_B03_O07]